MTSDITLSTLVKLLENDTRLGKMGITTINLLQENNSMGYPSNINWIINYKGRKITLVIEVKIESPMIVKQDILKLENTLSQIKEENKNGILVYSNVISKEALNYASKKNIILVRTRPNSEEDWDGRIREININMQVIVPSTMNYKFNIDKEKAKELLKKANKENFMFNFSGLSNELNFFDDSGKSITLQDIIKKHEDDITKDKGSQLSHIIHEFNQVTYFNTDIGDLQINSLEFDIKMEHISHPIIIDGNKDIGFTMGFSIVKELIQLNNIPLYLE